ncbi:MAG: nicotinate phosphoribosyltransferase [Acidobacteriota bacterium]
MTENDQRLAEGILFTDQYELSMAQLYFRMGLHEKRSQFDHFFRHYPDYGFHQAGFCINAGLEWFVHWLRRARFREEDLANLRLQRNPAGKPIFAEDFLAWLKSNANLEALSLKAIPEGRVVHANVPLSIVEGPLALAQIVETALLNHLNFQTLIATKAARIRESARKGALLEFGLRRGHHTGANAGARAALIGGADFTSNVGMSHVLGFPPKGTHAHRMVQVFMALGGGELEAFRAYAEVYPDDCLLLVDTIDTLGSGVPNAITVFEELRARGHRPVGIRLDSGDLAHLSIQAAKMLNSAGFPDAKIVLSNELDELVIWQILTQITEEAPKYGVDPDHLVQRLVYGVGTRLITSQGHPSLGGVYKLVAVEKDGEMAPVLKISDSSEKTANPGPNTVWRIYDPRGNATADLIGLAGEDPCCADKLMLRHPADAAKRRSIPREDISRMEPLLVDVMKDGRVVYDFPSIERIRELRNTDLEVLDSGVRRLVNPHVYHVSLTQALWELKQRLINAALNGAAGESDA